MMDLQTLWHIVVHPRKWGPMLRWYWNTRWSPQRPPDLEYLAHLAREKAEVRALLENLDDGESAVEQLAEADRAGRVNPPCSGCGGPHPFDTTVPSVVWNAAIRANHLPDYLCLTCIVAAFARANRSFTAELIGGGFHGLPIEVRVNGAVAQDAALISEENTRLRFSLAALGPAA